VTRHEAIVQAVVARLAASGAVAAGSVYRDRGDSIDAAALPAIDVRYEAGDPSELAASATRHSLSVSVEIRAREATGSAPSTVADSVAEIAHRALLADPTLGGNCRRLVLTRQTWRYQTSGDGTVVVLDQTYTAVHATRANDLAIAA
jgi:hypothetical protein